MKKYNLYISKTVLCGNGVFASRKIPKGTLIHQLDGDHVTLEVMVERVLSGDEKINDPLQVGMTNYIILDDTSRSFNHACSPNAVICGMSDLISIRDIVADEEITFDYSLTIAPTDWHMDCLCGSASCRKVASDVRSVPKAILEGYFGVGLLQDYMREIVPEILAGTYVIPQFEIDALNRLAGSL
jgi:hypothetical protein